MTLKTRIRQMSLRLGAYRGLRDFATWLYHRDGLKREVGFFKGLVPPGALVFDVGANRGQSAEVFLRAGARVVAFEPQIELHEEIRQRCASLGEFSLSAKALGRALEQRTLYLKDYDQVASLREDWMGTLKGSSNVEVSTLDVEIDRHGAPAYCKIDVEGWELQVIAGLSQPLPLISFEYHRDQQELFKAMECAAAIARLGDYEVNIREAGQASFLLSEFMAAANFMANGAALLGRDGGVAYGEVFMRVRRPPLSSVKVPLVTT